MPKKESRTYIATPPGKLIKEQITDRGITQKELAMRMDISEKHLSQLINGDAPLTSNIAYRLEMVLGIPASFWLNYEAIYRDKLEKVQQENQMDSDIETVKKYPYHEMAKLGWVEDTKNKYERVVNLRKFFEVFDLSLVQQPQLAGIACRRLSESERSDYALYAWAQRAKIEARAIEVQPINVAHLEESLPQIRHMTEEDPCVFSKKLCDLLAESGIALIYLPHMKGSFLHGATFLDGKKIVMGMTVRGKEADRFWFSLFHEIGHVVCGHIGRDSNDNDQDAEADQFASDTLIDPDDYQLFTKEKNFTEKHIRDFAAEQGIDPGIVVGRLQRESFIRYNQMNHLKQKYEIVLP